MISNMMPLKQYLFTLVMWTIFSPSCPLSAANELPKDDVFRPAPAAAGNSQYMTGSSEKENHLALDAGILMASLSYARRTSDNWFLGMGGGVGGDFLGYMILAGHHYSEFGGWSYENKDGFRDKMLFGLIHGELFARYEPSKYWQSDFGIRSSYFLHFDSSSDDAGGGVSAGAFVNPMVGWKNLKVGPTVTAGGFWGCRDAREFGVYLSPLVVRVTLRW